MVPTLIVIGIVVVIGLWVAVTYNALVRLRNLVHEAWRQIDVELQRRHDLIPNLVDSVKGYATHEKSTLDEVTAARAAASSPGSSVAEQAKNENVLTQALGRLFAVAEAYPDLKASDNFQQLQAELANTEDRIAAGRRFYNANVRAINTKIEVFPSNLIAGPFGFQRAEYFEIENPGAREVPQVEF